LNSKGRNSLHPDSDRAQARTGAAKSNDSQEKFRNAPIEVPNNVQSLDSSTWRSSAPVERWCNELLHIIGCTPREVTEKVDLLLQFCAEQPVSPERLINECRDGPDRMEKRALYLSAARRTKMNLVVQSFLVHNGINVFGELVCMPATVKLLIEDQGDQWEPRRS
jgi:hypothetical protein